MKGIAEGTAEGTDEGTAEGIAEGTAEGTTWDGSTSAAFEFTTINTMLTTSLWVWPGAVAIACTTYLAEPAWENKCTELLNSRLSLVGTEPSVVYQIVEPFVAEIDTLRAPK